MPLEANRIAESSFSRVKVFPLRIFYPLLFNPTLAAFSLFNLTVPSDYQSTDLRIHI